MVYILVWTSCLLWRTALTWITKMTAYPKNGPDRKNEYLHLNYAVYGRVVICQRVLRSDRPTAQFLSDEAVAWTTASLSDSCQGADDSLLERRTVWQLESDISFTRYPLDSFPSTDLNIFMSHSCCGDFAGQNTTVPFLGNFNGPRSIAPSAQRWLIVRYYNVRLLLTYMERGTHPIIGVLIMATVVVITADRLDTRRLWHR